MEAVTLILGIIALAVIIYVTRKYHKKWKGETKTGEQKKKKKKKPVERDSLF